MRPAWGVVLGVVFLAALLASCGGQKEATTTTTSATTAPSTSVSSTTVSPPTTTTSNVESLTVTVTPSPNLVSPGVPVTFTIQIRGPGTLSGESVAFGDGGTNGANAGAVSHSYTAPGTYEVSDEVSVIGPPPSCASEDVTGSTTVVASSPLATATSNGAFLSPTKNIACVINPAADYLVRCVTFSPPQLVTMSSTGSLSTCSGKQCALGNPSPDEPVLPYGAATGEGPSQCLSSVSAMTCTVTSGKGFRISRSGIEALGG